MDTISSIRIENFQAHKDFSIDFDDCITTITGPSDKGKSAIIRALIWVITNRPSGDEFIRYGSEECRVTVVVGKHVVQRIKGKKQNCYIVDGVEHKALKTDVPVEVQKIFNVDSNNIQSQFDPIFWFSSTGGEVARNLNRIINLDIIDYVLGELQNKVKQNKAQVEIIGDLILQQHSVLKDRLVIESAHILIQRINTYIQQHQSLIKTQEQLRNNIKAIEGLQNFLQRNAAWEEICGQFLATAAVWRREADRKKTLQSILSDIEKQETIIHREKIPDEFDHLLERITRWQQDLQTLRQQWRRLRHEIQNVEEISAAIQREEKEAITAEQNLHEILNNNTCPLCGRRN